MLTKLLKDKECYNEKAITLIALVGRVKQKY